MTFPGTPNKVLGPYMLLCEVDSIVGYRESLTIELRNDRLTFHASRPGHSTNIVVDAETVKFLAAQFAKAARLLETTQ